MNIEELDDLELKVSGFAMLALDQHREQHPNISVHIPYPRPKIGDGDRYKLPVQLLWSPRHGKFGNLQRVVTECDIVLPPPLGMELRQYVQESVDAMVAKYQRNMSYQLIQQIEQLYTVSVDHKTQPGDLVELVYDTLVLAIEATGVKPAAWRDRSEAKKRSWRG